MRRRPRRLVAAVVAAGLLAACSSDGATAPTSAPGPGPGTSGTTPGTTGVSPGTTATTASTGDATTVPPGTAPSIPPTAPSTAPATSPPPGDPSIRLTPIATFQNPLDMAWRTGDDTLYVVQQTGHIYALRNGTKGPVVLDIDRLTNGGGEQGLLGLAFSPDGRFAYVDYTDTAGDTVIAEYAVEADGTFVVASRRQLLKIDQPYANHNGGNLVFGPDGHLYIGMGDGGSGGDPQRRALRLDDLLGKVLRINPAPSADLPYTIPADNPFVGRPGARGEIWAIGVRNPWRFGFDRLTGDMWLADVGQNRWEEVNFAPASGGRNAGRGLNFGWSAFEGTHRFNTDQPAEGVTPPVHEYPHGNDTGCSINGGAVYRGTRQPALVGWYLFSDYCSGNIYGLTLAGGVVDRTDTFARLASITAIREDPTGELYAISLAGQVARIDPA